MSSLLGKLRGSGLKTRLLHPLDELWDRRLGVYTTLGRHSAGGIDGKVGERVHYAPTPYSVIFRLLRHAALSPDDIVVDLGSGLGRVIFAASRLGARRSVGVEVNEDLHSRACANLQGSRLAERNIEFVCMPAEQHIERQATIIYLFHPFREATMNTVLRHLEHSVEENPRNLRIIYLNPVCEDVLDRSKFLHRLDYWPPSGVGFLRGGRYAVSFWGTTPRNQDANGAPAIRPIVRS